MEWGRVILHEKKTTIKAYVFWEDEHLAVTVKKPKLIFHFGSLLMHIENWHEETDTRAILHMSFNTWNVATRLLWVNLFWQS